MSKITVQNTTSHDISLNLMDDHGVVQTANVPAKYPHPTEKGKHLAGEAEVEQSLIEAAAKAHPVVKSYFDNGELRFKRSSKAAAPAPTTPAQPAK